MSKKRKIDLDRTNWFKYRQVALAVSMVIDDEMDDSIIIGGIRRPRTHAFWMSPYLKARTDTRQRNTLAKLEADFIRVRLYSMLCWWSLEGISLHLVHFKKKYIHQDLQQKVRFPTGFLYTI